MGDPLLDLGLGRHVARGGDLLGLPQAGLRRSLVLHEAEIIALSECSKDVVYYRKKMSGIDPTYVVSPTETSTDNKGAHDLSYNPEFHARSKHIKRRHFFVRDMVEAHELVVPLIGTDVNIADFFTKPMSPEKFVKFRNHIMNIEPRAALAATCQAVVRAPGNGVPLSAAAVPFFPSVWGERLD